MKLRFYNKLQKVIMEIEKVTVFSLVSNTYIICRKGYLPLLLKTDAFIFESCSK